MSLILLLTLFLAPAYIFKFEVFGLPLNWLFVWIVIIWLVFCMYLFLSKRLEKFVNFIKQIDHRLLWLVSLFFLSGVISLFWQGFSPEKLGQFMVLFFQPISLFFISSFIWHQHPASKPLIFFSLYFLLALLGLLATLQYLTLWQLPPEYWGNNLEHKRAIAFFSHPNFYALFSAPLLAFLLPDLGLKLKDLRKNFIVITSWIIGVVGLGLSLSRAGWLGFGLAGLIYLLFFADKTIKKIAVGIIATVIILIISIPNFRWRLVLPFYGEKSAISRLNLWQSGMKAIKSSPVFGLGLKGFANNYQTFQTNKTLDTHNFPHNIFLNFWVETGIMGVISFMGLIGLLIYNGLKSKQNTFQLGVALCFITLISQGMFDNPYFKNDLALMFWIIISFAI